MSTILENIRDPLRTALLGVTASVYSSVPEAIIPPACVILYGAPMMESTLIGKDAIRVKLNFNVTAAVAYNSNAGSLDNLEKLIIEILGAIPSGYVVGDVTTPAITSVGASNLLVADLSISTYYTQT